MENIKNSCSFKILYGCDKGLKCHLITHEKQKYCLTHLEFFKKNNLLKKENKNKIEEVIYMFED